MKRILFLAMVTILPAMVSCQSNNSASNEMKKDFLQLASERFSVRQFDSTLVDQQLIDKILRAGQIAPTAVNAQPQKILVVKSPENMAVMNSISPCMYGAPHCFVVCYDSDIAVKRGENGTYGEIDATIALTHMVLEAADLGIGTCIVGRFNPDELSAAFNLPANLHPVLLIPFGYASSEAKPSPRHEDKRPVEQTVTYL